MSYNDIINRHHFKPWLGVLPGWKWVDKHEHDLDGWQPRVEIDAPGIKYNMTIKEPKVVSEICKANR